MRWITCLLILAIPVSTFRVVNEGISALPAGWSVVDRKVDVSEIVNLHLALTRNNMSLLHKNYQVITDPTHPMFGRWLEREELTLLIGPPQKNVDTVTEWLSQHGIRQYRLDFNRDWIHVNCTIRQAEALLRQQFRVYEHKQSGQQLSKAVGPVSVPDHIAPCLDVIVGAGSFPPTFQSVQVTTKGLPLEITPKLVIERYNISTSSKESDTNNKAIVALQASSVSQKDVCDFYKTFKLNGTCQVARHTGDKPGSGQLQGTADAEWADATSDTTPLFVYEFNGMDFCSDLVNWITAVSEQEKPGWVQSVAYGYSGSMSLCDTQVEKRIEEDIMKNGARGVSFLVASGAATENGGKLYVDWPASSEYVTAVGSTQFDDHDLNKEIGTNISGGGFANNVSRPVYQNKEVGQFWDTVPKNKLPTATYNKNGKGVPDVSTLGLNVVIILGGEEIPVSGSALSVSMMCGIVARLNNARLLAGKKPLGPLNEFLYSVPHAFYDVTEGQNGKPGSTTGWYAQKGWDPVTGLGTPNFVELVKAAMSLP